MSKITVLTKAFLKNSYQSNFNNLGEENISKNAKKRLKNLLIYALLFAYLAVVFGILSYNIIETLIQVGQPQLFLTIFLFGVIALILIQSTFYHYQ